MPEIAHTVVPVEEPLPTSTSEDTQSTTSDHVESSPCQRNLLPWKIFCLILVLLVAVGWVCIIVLLILKEEWQLVMVSWLILYAGGHFSIWYFRRNSRRGDPNATIVQRLVARLQGEQSLPTEEKPQDAPPSYEDLIKCETPPPAYYNVVRESRRLNRMFFRSLPWFLKKKFLTAPPTADTTVNSTTNSPSIHKSEASTSGINVNTVSSSLPDYDYQNDELWKVCGGGGPRVDSLVVADVPLTDIPESSRTAVRQLQQFAAKHKHLQRTSSTRSISSTTSNSSTRSYLSTRSNSSSRSNSSTGSNSSTRSSISEQEQPVLTPIHQALAKLPSYNSAMAHEVLDNK